MLTHIIINRPGELNNMYSLMVLLVFKIGESLIQKPFKNPRDTKIVTSTNLINVQKVEILKIITRIKNVINSDFLEILKRMLHNSKKNKQSFMNLFRIYYMHID